MVTLSLVRKISIAFALAALSSCAQVPAYSQSKQTATTRPYSVFYTLTINPGDGDVAEAGIRVEQESWRLRELKFRIDPDRHSDFEADGELHESDGKLTWSLP